MEEDKKVIESLLDVDPDDNSWGQVEWECLHCRKSTTIIQYSKNYQRKTFNCKYNDGINIAFEKITCPNKKCNKESTLLTYHKYIISPMGGGNYCPIKHWQIEPRGNFKDFTMYKVPEHILRDYEEACLIKSISPNASATMSRRCLQSMVRDYWGIKERSLFEEIEKLKKIDNPEKGKVRPIVLNAIDNIRKIGNIGSHFKENENEMLSDVTEYEAGKMIWLIEHLIDNWYVQRYENKKHLEELNQSRNDEQQD